MKESRCCRLYDSSHAQADQSGICLLYTSTLDKYVPDGDYVVIKFARWAFEKFKGVEDKLGTQMRAVGEVMSIGKTYLHPGTDAPRLRALRHLYR